MDFIDEQPTPVVEPPRQWEPWALVAVIAGLYWLLGGEGGMWWLMGLVPGGLLLSTGLSQLLIPGDVRVPALMAVGALIGILLLPVVLALEGFGTAFYTTLGSIGSFVVAGRIGLLATRRSALGVPAPDIDAEMSIKAGLDGAMLGYFLLAARQPSGRVAEQMLLNADALRRHQEAQGWGEHPERMHAPPPPPEQTYITRARSFGVDYDVLRFSSDYTPPSGMPSASWLEAPGNRQCEVRVLRHVGAPRPWLLCLHGYRMGMPWMDLSLFSPAWLHEKLGLNIIQPVLPLHGVRRVTRLSGGHFVDGDLLDLVLAEAQTLWDIRRTLAWLRAQEEDPQIGVFGISLGGYNAALLSGFDAQLKFVIAGIPVTDFASALWSYLSPDALAYFSANGFDEAQYRKLLRPVSPLAVKPLLAAEQLHLFAATGDQIVPARQAAALARHWAVPVQWYAGSHLSLRRERTTRQVVAQAVRAAGWH